MTNNRNGKVRDGSSRHDATRQLNRHGVGALLRQVFAGLMNLESDGHLLRFTSDGDRLHRINF